MSENTNPTETPAGTENTNPAQALPLALTVTEEKSKPKEEDQEITKMGDKAIKIKLVLFLLTVLSFLLSLPILFSVIWLEYMRHSDCEEIMKLPKFQMGIVIGLIIVFLVSNAVLYLRTRFPMPGLILIMVPLILMLTVGLALVGAYKMESKTIPGSPMSLKMRVFNGNYWNNIKSCIYNTRTCEVLVSRSYMLKAYDFTAIKLSPVESGCCIPPASCGMEYVNATFWRKRDGNETDSSIPCDIDCDLWQNQETSLCYSCQACKQGFLRTLLGKWLKLGLFLIVMALLLILSHLFLFAATMWETYRGK